MELNGFKSEDYIYLRVFEEFVVPVINDMMKLNILKGKF